MALYHFHADLIRRSAGQSAVSAAAYRAAEKLHSEYYGDDPDYTHKGGVCYTEIFLPTQAPTAYQDRETLWNAVEKAEEHPQAQLAYSYDIALQNELTLEENIALARKFVQEQFVSKGMVVDLAVHVPDKACPNPHIHLLCPIRPIDENGQWGEKSHRVYELDEQGNKVRGKNGKPICHCVSTTGWGSKEQLLAWREAWANYVNRAFEQKGLPCRIDHRSNAERGLEELATIHEGPRVRAMEAKGILTEKGNLNRLIRSLNESLQGLRSRITALRQWLSEVREKLKESEQPEQPDLGQLLAAYLEQRNNGAWSRAGKISNLKNMAQVVNFLADRNIHSVDDLNAHADAMHEKYSACKASLTEKKKQAEEVQELLQMVDLYVEKKPVFDKYNSFKFKGRKEKYKAEHDADLKAYYKAARKLKPHFTADGKLPITAWKKKLARLEGEINEISDGSKGLWDETKKLLDIQTIVDNMLRQREQREHTRGSRDSDTR